MNLVVKTVDANRLQKTINREWVPVSILEWEHEYWVTHLHALMVWCEEYQSSGRFAWGEPIGIFYFERSEDAIIFILRWT